MATTIHKRASDSISIPGILITYHADTQKYAEL